VGGPAVRPYLLNERQTVKAADDWGKNYLPIREAK